MKKWYQIYPTNKWFNIYAWILFCIMPFFFIFRSMSIVEIASGLGLFALFFVSYRASNNREGAASYAWLGIEIVICFTMTVAFGFIYFFLFVALQIGNIRKRVPFFIYYGINTAVSASALVLVIFTEPEIFVSQYPFLIMTEVGVLLIPFNAYTRHQREVLEEKLEDANRIIADLIVQEERQRIARDLHDTLGQKLSLIGLKSDLASKLAQKDPSRAQEEMLDVRRTARTALKEVRDLVSGMRGTSLTEELQKTARMLEAAGIRLTIDGTTEQINPSPYIDDVLGMCLMEAVTNVVRHSGADTCMIRLEKNEMETRLTVADDGNGAREPFVRGNGLRGMEERMEFVNGRLSIGPAKEGTGTELTVRIPNIIQNKNEVTA
ncbi:sensor histidine kinase [Bhargavaea ullalensis]|uniref:histidine kinase n=1 Tax=Bhargavaea ullalensis TaxID=1265685 RepID=A0ABV2G8E3_9BACL